jgi:hypothetical protein
MVKLLLLLLLLPLLLLLLEVLLRPDAKGPPPNPPRPDALTRLCTLPSISLALCARHRLGLP